jgi:hypothetical protein
MSATTLQQDIAALEALTVSILTHANRLDGEARTKALDDALKILAAAAVSTLGVKARGDHQALALMADTFSMIVESVAAGMVPTIADSVAKGRL